MTIPAMRLTLQHTLMLSSFRSSGMLFHALSSLHLAQFGCAVVLCMHMSSGCASTHVMVYDAHALSLGRL